MNDLARIPLGIHVGDVLGNDVEGPLVELQAADGIVQGDVQ